MKVVPIDCRKDRGLRAAWRLALPTSLLPCCWEAVLLNHRIAGWIARLAAHGWISSLRWWLISWMPGSLCWPESLLPGVTKIRLLPAASRWQVSLLLPTASSFPLLLPGLSLHLRHPLLTTVTNCHQVIVR